MDITESLVRETEGTPQARARATSACRLLLCIVQIDKSIYIGKTNAPGMRRTDPPGLAVTEALSLSLSLPRTRDLRLRPRRMYSG